MQTTIQLNSKTTKWSFIFNGILQLLLIGTIFMQNNSPNTWKIVLWCVWVVAVSLYLLYGIALTYPNNKLAPYVRINENNVFVKNGWNTKIEIAWERIQDISYGSYEIKFLLKNNQEEKVRLKTSAEISVQVKRAIREFADKKQITVFDG